MTKQEVLNKVYLAVRAQGKPSRSHTGTCLYRGPDGLKCAAGHLIADQHYTPAIEGLSASNPAVFKALEASGVGSESVWTFLVSDLQRIHDGSADDTTGDYAFEKSDYSSDFVAYWDREVAALAARYGLILPQVPA